jgi:hypothetical protein
VYLRGRIVVSNLLQLTVPVGVGGPHVIDEPASLIRHAHISGGCHSHDVASNCFLPESSVPHKQSKASQAAPPEGFACHLGIRLEHRVRYHGFVTPDLRVRSWPVEGAIAPTHVLILLEYILCPLPGLLGTRVQGKIYIETVAASMRCELFLRCVRRESSHVGR